LPSNMAHRQVTSFRTEEALGLMDEGGVDAAVIHPPGWDPHSHEMAFKAVRDYPRRFAILGSFPLDQPDKRGLVETWRSQPGMLGLRYGFLHEPMRGWLADGTLDWLWAAAERAGVPVPGGREGRGARRITGFLPIRLTQQGAHMLGWGGSTGGCLAPTSRRPLPSSRCVLLRRTPAGDTSWSRGGRTGIGVLPNLGAARCGGRASAQWRLADVYRETASDNQMVDTLIARDRSWSATGARSCAAPSRARRVRLRPLSALRSDGARTLTHDLRS